MGCCFSRLDSIEHAKSLGDIIDVMSSDKLLFQYQVNIIKEDKSLSKLLKEKKFQYFTKITTKLDEYIKYLMNKAELSVS